MRKKIGILFAMITFCLLLNVIPAMAGEWRKTGEDQWQYMKDDGSKATANPIIGSRMTVPGTISMKMV